jgi:nucleotide-binding universal stress UspA family protein
VAAGPWALPPNGAIADDHDVVWLAFGGLWVVCGASSAVLMARRGHDPATWTLLGLLFGPVAPLFAAEAIGEERTAEARVLDRGVAEPGSVHLVAGVDGSPESVAAVRSAVALLHGRLGRIAIAVVVPYDADAGPHWRCALAAAAQELEPASPTTVELRGEPAAALRRYALDEGFDVIVVGARGRGRSGSPLGSVALRLASGSPVPVLIGPATPPS